MALSGRKATSQYGADWTLTPTTADGHTWSVDRIQIILLQEIRDELKKLNALLNCPNFVGIPGTLKGIRRKLPTPVRTTKGT